MAMHITNIGGSLTTAVCLSLIAWSIRVLRAQKLAEQKSQNGGARRAPFREGTLPSIRTSRRAYARLSPTAFWLLVEARSIRPILVDVRAAKELEESLEDDISKRLDLLRIPVEELGHVLRARNTEWKARTGQPAPTLRATIVFVSTHGHSAAQAANIAMSLGFQRCAVIEGGLAAAAPSRPLRPVHPDGTRRRHTRIRRHAVRHHSRCQRHFRRVQILALVAAVDNPARRDPVPRRVTAPPRVRRRAGRSVSDPHRRAAS